MQNAIFGHLVWRELDGELGDGGGCESGINNS